jgi:aspartyl-tRNA(Asn)/glutamyl-tRNA(Gln) amidotransferase subunit A
MPPVTVEDIMLDCPSLAPQGLYALSESLSKGEITALSLMRQAIEHLSRLEPQLEAFSHVDTDRALRHATALDELRASGVSLGPLMGMPIAIKDLCTVDGMPTTAGSRIDIQDLVPPQGRFVHRLLASGCVPLGKTRTSEFALGGLNLNRPPPWNPCDLNERRMTGGSSHGSAVAMAAGLAAFTVGSDTGGSVRWPAALCGVVGYKASSTHWPIDGVFPLSPEMDSLGIFTQSAADAAFVEAALASRPVGAVMPVESLRLAVPTPHFLEHLEAPVRHCFDEAVKRLDAAGVKWVQVPAPEAGWIDDIFRSLVPAELLAFLGRERVEAQGSELDAVVTARLQGGLALQADEYVRMLALRRQAEQAMNDRSHLYDAWIMPTVSVLPHPISRYRSLEEVAAWNRLAPHNTRPANLYGQCGISLPIQHLGAELPVGLQLVAPRGADVRLLQVACAVEQLLNA